MPYKFNASRRHKFEKKRYRVTNWAEYNESLRRRGDLTVWIDTDALKLWTAPRQGSRGGQQRYSDMAITICLTLRIPEYPAGHSDNIRPPKPGYPATLV